MLEAYLITGNSWFPLYKEGDLIYVSKEQSRPLDAMLGNECAIQLAGTGALVFKTLCEGGQPGTYTLKAPGALDLESMKLAWAAPVIHIARRPKQPPFIGG